MKRVLATLVALSAAALLAAGAGSAAPQQPQTLSCDGLGDIQITAGPANGADQSWGAAQIVGGGHLIPLSFEFSAYDVTKQAVIFDAMPVKGGSHAHASGPVTTCSSSQEGTLQDLLDPGEAPPPGTSLTDQVIATFTATVVVKP